MAPTNSTTTRRCRRDNPFFRKLALTLVSIFVIMMAIISIAWLAMHPHDPGFKVTSLSVTNFSVSGSEVRGKYEVELTLTNPNKMRTQVVLHRVGALVLYDHEWNSVAAVQQQRVSMEMEKLTNESVRVDFEVMRWESRVPEVVVKEYRKKGVVNFNVVLSVKVRFEAGIWPSMDKLLEVRCLDLHVGFLSITKDTGKLLGVGKDCDTVNAAGRT